MIVSARTTLARLGSGERKILSASSLLLRTPCDGHFKTSRHNILEYSCMSFLDISYVQ